MTRRIPSGPASRRCHLLPVLALGLAAAASGCGDDAAGPSGGVLVLITASAEGEVFDRSPEASRMDCRVDLTATAIGARGARAEWLGAELSFRARLDGGREFFSMTMSRAQMLSVWGSDGIAGGETRDGGLILWASWPFRVVGEFRYASGTDGGERTVDFEAGCGPDVPAGSSGPPTGSGLTVSVPAGEFEPLDTLTVSYTASAPLGLWSTVVILSGAFEDTVHLYENHARSTDRTVPIQVPRGSLLGRSVDVRVVAVDIGMQTAGSPTASTPPLQDATPPAVDVWLVPFVGECRVGPCQYAQGDSIGFYVTGTDNHSLGWLIYEVGDPEITRDSIAYLSSTWHGYQRAPVPPEWLGTQPVRAAMRDVAGNVDHGAHLDGHTIHVYPVRERPADTLALALKVADAGLDAARGRLYLSDRGRAEIVVVALDPLAVDAPIPLPGPADGFDLSIGGDSLLVVIPDSNAVAVVDLAMPGSAPELVPLTGVDTAAGYRASSLRVTANGKWFVTANTAAVLHEHYGALVEFDPVTGAQTTRFSPADVGEGVTFDMVRLVRTGDRTRLLVGMSHSCAYIYDAGTDAFGPCVTYATGGPTQPAAPDWTGSRWATLHDLYDAAFTPLRELPPRGMTNVVAPTPDGQRVYTASSLGIEVIDAGTGLVQERIPGPYLWDGRLLFSAAGDRAVAVGALYYDRAATRVAVIDRP